MLHLVETNWGHYCKRKEGKGRGRNKLYLAGYKPPVTNSWSRGVRSTTVLQPLPMKASLAYPCFNKVLMNFFILDDSLLSLSFSGHPVRQGDRVWRHDGHGGRPNRGRAGQEDGDHWPETAGWGCWQHPTTGIKWKNDAIKQNFLNGASSSALASKPFFKEFPYILNIHYQFDLFFYRHIRLWSLWYPNRNTKEHFVASAEGQVLKILCDSGTFSDCTENEWRAL